MPRFLIACALFLFMATGAEARIDCDRFGCRDAQNTPRISSRARTAHVSLSGVVAPLAAKARQIVSVCGSRVISARRHTNIAGTRKLSLHAFGKAVDLQGNPRCIYRQLADWPGGVSTDYNRVKHVHISYDPGRREWGLRFAHGRGRSRLAQR